MIRSLDGQKPEIKKYDLNSLEFKRNPFPHYARWLDDGPIIWSRLPILGKCWLVSSHSACTELLRDQKRFVRDSKNAGRRFLAGLQWWMPKRLTRLANNMLAFDGEKHRRLRSLVDQAFQRHSVEKMNLQIVAFTDQLLNELEAQTNSADGIDVVQHFARRLPLQVICELLGLPDEDREMFTYWFKNSTEVRSVLGIFKMIPMIGKLNRYLTDQFEQVRRNPRPGLMTELVQAEQGGDRLNADELLSMVFLLLLAGYETTVHLISTGMYSLLQHPQQKQMLIDDWSLAPNAVDEILRFASPIQMTKPRMVAEDLTWHGATMKRGDLIVPLIGAANADPDQFDSPEIFDIHRDNASSHRSFGNGPHVCLGMKLAKAEAQIAFERLFTRFPNIGLAVSDDQHEWTRRLGIRAFRKLPIRLDH